MRRPTTIRVVVVLLVVCSAAYALRFAEPIARTLGDITSAVAGDSRLAGAWAASAAIVLAGHAFRAWRDTKLFSKATKSRVRSQLGAFAVGQLCSAVLPLKLGEFVRADIIAQRYRISYSFTFALVCVERLVDAVVLFVLSLVFVGFFAPLAVIAVALGLVVWVLWASPGWFKRLLSALGSVLDDKVEARLLFVFWSLEYGLRRTLVPRMMVPYALTGLLNWAIYLTAFCVLVNVATGAGLLGCVSAATGAYAALTTAVTPAALGSYSATLAAFGLHDAVVYIMLWMAAIVPIALVGLYFALFKLRGLPLLRPRVAGKRDAADNKLSRTADASADQLGFLEDYYAGKPLALKVARDEMGGGPAVQRYLSGGGSGAVTYLSRVDGGTCVTKVVPVAKSQALRQQYAWLRDHANSLVVGVAAEREDGEAYAIDIDYEQGSIDCFDYVHSCAADGRVELLDSVVEMLADKVWDVKGVDPAGEMPDGNTVGDFPGGRDGLPFAQADDARTRVESYLAKHVETSLALAREALPSLGALMDAKTLVVNGEKCPNVAQLVAQIRASQEMMDDLCSFRLSPAIHGDLIMDNIIWSPGRGHAVVLDPVPCGNFLDGPVFDFGKLSQSLWVGYEFMLRDTRPARVEKRKGGVVSVTYADGRSAAYEQMWRHVADELAPRYLTQSERRTMLFVGATNFLRRMKHQAVQCPANAPAFYAAGALHLYRYVRMFHGK